MKEEKRDSGTYGFGDPVNLAVKGTAVGGAVGGTVVGIIVLVEARAVVGDFVVEPEVFCRMQLILRMDKTMRIG